MLEGCVQTTEGVCRKGVRGVNVRGCLEGV